MLRTPVLCRVVGNRLITVYVVGPESGRHYAVPVAYTWHDQILPIGTPFAWGRNLRTGQPVDIRLRGKRRPADVEGTAFSTTRSLGRQPTRQGGNRSGQPAVGDL
jgi:hypothetical protein